MILNLCWLRHEGLFSAIFAEVIAPSVVQCEFDFKVENDPRFHGLIFPPFLTVADIGSVPAELASDANLDPGEIATITLALERRIAGVLIDETCGRAAAVS